MYVLKKMDYSLSKDLSLMLNDVYDHNVIILRACSHYFQIVLSKKWVAKKNNNNMIKYKKPNIHPNNSQVRDF